MNGDGCVLNCVCLDSPLPSILNNVYSRACCIVFSLSISLGELHLLNLELNIGQYTNIELNYAYTNTKIMDMSYAILFNGVIINNACIHVQCTYMTLLQPKVL